jgi:hypothetical protein
LFPEVEVQVLFEAMRGLISRIVFARWLMLLHVFARWCLGVSPIIEVMGEELTSAALKHQRDVASDGNPLLLAKQPPKGACGDWYHKYAKVHAQIRQHGRGRYMFHQCDEGQAGFVELHGTTIQERLPFRA